MGSTGTNIALTSFTDGHPDFRAAWQHAITAVNADIQKNFDDYLHWVADTDGTKFEYVKTVDTGRRVQHRAVPPNRREAASGRV